MWNLNSKIGVEIELMAPRGLSRETLAKEIAPSGGKVRRFFHPQSEPSKVPGTPVFENLTLGFEVVDAEGLTVARLVDDLTLQQDCERTCSPLAGWYRIVSDDARLLRLVARQTSPAAAVGDVLKPVAALFGTEIETLPGGAFRVADETGCPIAIAAPLPGERERPCELITPPIDTNHLSRLEALLSVARELKFTAPIEGATHLHFDATPLCSARVLSNLVKLLWTHGDNLRRLVDTNPQCQRRGSWDKSLWHMVGSSEFSQLPWADARDRLSQLKLTKYCDFNLKNLIHPLRDKYTFEVRIFPVWLKGQPIVEAAGLMEGILRKAIESDEVPTLETLPWHPVVMEEFLGGLPMCSELRKIWQVRVFDCSN